MNYDNWLANTPKEEEEVHPYSCVDKIWQVIEFVANGIKYKGVVIRANNSTVTISTLPLKEIKTFSLDYIRPVPEER